MIFGKILEAFSEGEIDDYSLAPTQFINKRFRKEATTTTFHRDSGTISFSESDASYPLKGSAQDRSFNTGTDWTFVVAGMRDAETWTFKVIKNEKNQHADG